MEQEWRALTARRHPSEHRWKQCQLPRVRDAPARPDRQVCRCLRTARCHDPRRGRPLGSWGTDPRRGACLGGGRRRLGASGTAAIRHGGATYLFHGTVGDSDRECREPRRCRATCRGAGGVAAGRDAGRPRRTARRAVRRRRRGLVSQWPYARASGKNPLPTVVDPGGTYARPHRRLSDKPASVRTTHLGTLSSGTSKLLATPRSTQPAPPWLIREIYGACAKELLQHRGAVERVGDRHAVTHRQGDPYVVGHLRNQQRTCRQAPRVELRQPRQRAPVVGTGEADGDRDLRCNGGLACRTSCRRPPILTRRISEEVVAVRIHQLLK